MIIPRLYFNNHNFLRGRTMDYKKLMSLAAASIFVLSACGNKDEKPAEEASDDATEAFLEEAENSEQLTPDVGLSLFGEWTTDGYVFGGEDNVAIIGEVDGEDFTVYLLDDEGTVLQTSTEPEISFEVQAPAEGESNNYVVGVSKEDLGAEGDKVDDVEKFERYENVITEYAVEEAEEEE